MLNRVIIIFFFFFLTVRFCSAQLQPAGRESFWERVYFGGNVGFQFGSQTLVNVNPLIGYRLTERFSVGITATYIYYHLEDPYYNIDYSTDIYGGSIFTRYFILENIFAHVEGEILNMEIPNYFNHLVRENIFGFYVGGGYRQPLGERSSLNILLLYNLNEDRNSPYQNPIIRIGFGFGI